MGTYYFMDRCLGAIIATAAVPLPLLFSYVLHTFWRLLLSLPVRFFCDACHHQASYFIYTRSEVNPLPQLLYIYLCTSKCMYSFGT